MYTDKNGTKRYKVGLHIHTTVSDGQLPPKEVIARYKSAGYDVIALTDHWKYHGEDRIDGVKILSGCEFNLGGGDTSDCVMHIVGVGMRYAPALTPNNTRQEVIDGIRAAGGIAILAHPMWSLNTPEHALELDGFAATEIYNTVSGLHQSFRAYSGCFVDLLANKGRAYPLVAADDSHYYDGDECRSYIMAAAESDSTSDILKAIENGDFYATQGPELLVKRENGKLIVDCSPSEEIFFMSNSAWEPDHAIRGEGLTHAEYQPSYHEKWIRVEIRHGNDFAWSNVIWVNE